MARALLIPHAPTSGLAHVGACMAVGGRLRERGHDVTIAYGGTRAEVIEREGFDWRPVPEVAPEREWSPGGWFTSEAELHSLVDGHLELLEELRPDVAVVSSGVAGRLACELAGVPVLHLMHYIQTTEYGRRPIVWGDRLRDARHPRRAARVLRARLGRRGRRQTGTPSTMRVVAAVRSQLGLPPIGRADYGAARDTLVAITSAPFVDAADGLPGHWRHIGPVTWSAPVSGPEADVKRGERPLVYVTQGSTGSPELLRRAVSELATGALDLLVATGGLCDPGEITALGPRVRAADLLPGRACLEAADAAVIHGGHLTFSEALATGTPVVVVPHRSDQTARVNRVERLGVGRAVWPPPRRPGAIRRAVERVLQNPGYARRSSELAGKLEGWDGARNAAELAERLASNERVA